MSAVPSRTRRHTRLLTPCYKCECCGNKIVLLRQNTSYGLRWRRCYVKNWDGNPWYVPGTHTLHPRYRNGKPTYTAPQEPPTDPDFA